MLKKRKFFKNLNWINDHLPMIQDDETGDVCIFSIGTLENWLHCFKKKNDNFIELFVYVFDDKENKLTEHYKKLFDKCTPIKR